MSVCYECEQVVERLVYRSRCVACTDRRVRANQACITKGLHVEAAQEALDEIKNERTD